MTTILICGGRFYRDAGTIERYIRSLPEETTTIIHGGCYKGADAIAHKLALEWNYFVIVYHADWQTHGRKAGPIRNQRMLDVGKPDKVVAFWDGVSPGTRDMIHRAKAAGVPVEIIWQKGCEPKQGVLPV